MITSIIKKLEISVRILILFSFIISITLPAGVSAQSSTSVTATITLTAPAFSDSVDVDLQWSVAGLPASATHYVLIWARKKAASATAYPSANCKLVSTIPPNVGGSVGVFTFSYSPLAVGSQDEVEFVLTVENTAVTGPGCTGAPASLPATTTPMSTAFIDTNAPAFFMANPPSLGTGVWNANRVACNTFEMWGLASDNLTGGASFGYSGLQSWNQAVTGIFVPPVEGTAPTLLSWQYTFPSTASGPWTFKVNPMDAAGNDQTAPADLRTAGAPNTTELANCKSFSDNLTGHPYGLYYRYLAQLNIFAGNADGSSGINNTLSRAEAATLFEKANGKTSAVLPVAPPTTACTFTDVNTTDWFAGWVWQACADGFMAGAGGGLFDPYGLFSRGQAVTVLNNINAGPKSSYFAAYSGTYHTVLNKTALWASTTPYRSIAWTDVPNGQYYTIPVQRAYNAGVADATGPTTFSPGNAILRGEFAKMLYHALSRIQ